MYFNYPIKEFQECPISIEFTRLTTISPHELFCRWKKAIESYTNDPSLSYSLYQTRLEELCLFFQLNKPIISLDMVNQYESALNVFVTLIKEECDILSTRLNPYPYPLHASMNNGKDMELCGQPTPLQGVTTTTTTTAPLPFMSFAPMAWSPWIPPMPTSTTIGMPMMPALYMGQQQQNIWAPQQTSIGAAPTIMNQGMPVPDNETNIMAQQMNFIYIPPMPMPMPMPMPPVPPLTTQSIHVSTCDPPNKKSIVSQEACMDKEQARPAAKRAKIEDGRVYEKTPSYHKEETNTDTKKQKKIKECSKVASSSSIDDAPNIEKWEDKKKDGEDSEEELKRKRQIKNAFDRDVRKTRHMVKKALGIKKEVIVHKPKYPGTFLGIVNGLLTDDVLLNIMDFIGYETEADGDPSIENGGIYQNAVFLFRSICKSTHRVVHTHPRIWHLNRIDMEFAGKCKKLRSGSNAQIADSLSIVSSRWVRRMILFHAYTTTDPTQLENYHVIPMSYNAIVDAIALSRSCLTTSLLNYVSNKWRAKENQKTTSHKATAMYNLLDYFIDYKRNDSDKKRWYGFLLSPHYNGTTMDNEDDLHSTSPNIFRDVMERCKTIEVRCETVQLHETYIVPEYSIFRLDNLRGDLLPDFSLRIRVSINGVIPHGPELLNKILRCLRQKYKLRLNVGPLDSEFMRDPERYTHRSYVLSEENTNDFL